MTHTPRRPRSFLTAGSALAMLLLVAGCDSVGEGVAPSGITIEPGFTGSARQREAAEEAFENGAPFEVTECLPAAMRVVLEFDNGSREDITRRSENVRYTSSNPAVLQVSNRDIPFLGDEEAVFPRGALLPVAAGTATVSVEFAGFRSSIDLQVNALGEITPFVDFPEVIAPASLAEVLADAVVQGQTTSVTSAAALSVEDVGGSDAGPFAQVTSVSGRSFVRGLLPSPTQRATLDFALCDRQFSKEFRVAEIEELRIERRNDDGEPLAIGFSELLDATAIFDDGSTQNLNNQADFETEDNDNNVLLLLQVPARSNSLVLGLSGSQDTEETCPEPGEGGSATVLARFDQDPSVAVPDSELPDGASDLPEAESNRLPLTVRPGRAQAIRWRVEADGEGERVLEVPQGCTVQPGVDGDIEILREDGSRVTVTRRIDREVNYLVGDETIDTTDPVDPECDPVVEEGDGGADDDAGGDDSGADAPSDDDTAGEEEAEPVIEVVDRAALSSNLQAGAITAVGEVGEEQTVRAVLLQDPDLPGFDDGGAEPGELLVREDILRIRVTEPADCAPFEGQADL
ncbi:hypothetical protein [Algiphilus sp.]|uniref:hypothetical protein n=1 Tax=Algiphilus sp. TaxID=1872431 RepID=UPI003B5205C2